MIARERDIPIRFYGKKYCITERGMVKNKQTGIMVMPGGMKNRYLFVVLSYNGVKKHVYIHQMVAKAFIPNPENKRCVNHKNGDKWDNNIWNLEWCTHSENSVHYHKVLKQKL